jgi:copper homeostasis protein (lipoprotein)
MSRSLPLCLGIALVLLASCSREQAAGTAAEPATSAAPSTPAASAPGADVVAAVEPTAVPSSETPTFDQRAFAGAFAGGPHRLELQADGRYVLTSGEAMVDGTWTAEENDTRIRLDPNSKSEPDRVFSISGTDTLTALAADGRPATGTDAMTLTRAAD